MKSPGDGLLLLTVRINDPIDKSLIFCPMIPFGDLILKIAFKDPSEFLFFRNSQKFENAVEVRFFV